MNKLFGNLPGYKNSPCPPPPPRKAMRDDLKSDLEDLKYFFDKYRKSVETGKPDIRIANQLKTYIDTIQVKIL